MILTGNFGAAEQVGGPDNQGRRQSAGAQMVTTVDECLRRFFETSGLPVSDWPTYYRPDMSGSDLPTNVTQLRLLQGFNDQNTQA
jgi:hypothetical protein